MRRLPSNQGPSDTPPSQEMIDAAAREMREEIPRFIPLPLVILVLFCLCAGFFAAVLFV